MRETQGLFDLQVNGYAGVDFNDPCIDAEQLDHALNAMQRAGVTGCLPTVITAHWHELEQRFAALDRAVMNSKLGSSMVPGYHLEGPFLRDETGYSGCHPPACMSDPNSENVLALSRSLSRPILLTTLAPERVGAFEAIKVFRANGITVCVGHSSALYDDIAKAASAGASCSTHLGNGLPQTLHKLENTLLAQLAEKRLTACFIADGHHVSSNALRALITLKGVERSVLVTDAVLAAGATPGQYRFAGMGIELDAQGVVRIPGQGNLAGSALELDQAVRNVVGWGIASFEEAILMASDNPRKVIAASLAHHGIELDLKTIRWDEALYPISQY